MNGATDNENIYHQTYSTSANYNIFPPDKPMDYDHRYNNLPPHPRNDPAPRPPTNEYRTASEPNQDHKSIPTQQLLNRLHNDFDKFLHENNPTPSRPPNVRGPTGPTNSRGHSLNTHLQSHLAATNNFIPGPMGMVSPNDPSVSPHFQPAYNPEMPPPDSEAAESSKPEVNPDIEVSLEKDAWSQRALASMWYPQVYQDGPFYQLPQQNLILNPKPIYLFIDSRDRDRNRYPNPNSYRIPLVSSDTESNFRTTGTRYKNIYSISLLSAVVPNTNNVLDELYLVLQVDEIDPMYDASNPTCSRAFTKLHFSEVFTTGKFLRLDKGVGDPLTRVFYPKPLASLSSLTISFRKYDGTLFNFGTDSSPPANPIQDFQNSLTFEIVTKITDINEAIGHRNI